MTPNTGHKKLRFSAGVFALSLVVMGSMLGLVQLSMDAGSVLQKRTGALAGIVILVGGVLGLSAAARNEGRIPGLLAFGAMTLFVIWFFHGVIK
jgi:hypothetical protein